MAKQSIQHFKNILQKEKQFLNRQCNAWQNVLLDSEITEDAAGEIRTTIGLTELLLNQKLKQFSGLIDDCEFKKGERVTTCDDLQGFWDMVYFEVEKVRKKFKDLEELKSNGWKFENKIPVPTKKSKLAKPVVAKPPNKTSSSAIAHIMAARKRLAEAKAKAAKDKENECENFVVIKVPEPTQNPELKTKKNSDNTVKEKKRQDAKTKKNKEFIPLQCVTRSAKRAALIEQNKAAAK